MQLSPDLLQIFCDGDARRLRGAAEWADERATRAGLSSGEADSLLSARRLLVLAEKQRLLPKETPTDSSRGGRLMRCCVLARSSATRSACLRHRLLPVEPSLLD